jgi:hypothetical protein
MQEDGRWHLKSGIWRMSTPHRAELSESTENAAHPSEPPSQPAERGTMTESPAASTFARLPSEIIERYGFINWPRRGTLFRVAYPFACSEANLLFV